jgi:hypothetical protein
MSSSGKNIQPGERDYSDVLRRAIKDGAVLDTTAAGGAPQGRKENPPTLPHKRLIDDRLGKACRHYYRTLGGAVEALEDAVSPYKLELDGIHFEHVSVGQTSRPVHIPIYVPGGDLDRWELYVTYYRMDSGNYEITAYVNYLGSDRGRRRLAPGTRRSNPVTREGEIGAAVLYEEFHGKPSAEVAIIKEEIEDAEHVTVLGLLIELVVKSATGKNLIIEFDPQSPDKDAPPYLCSSPDGRQLYIRGGDQSLDLASIGLSGKWERDQMVVGDLRKVTYRTEKNFDQFESLDYEHKLGEDSGVKPILCYDALNAQLLIVGGQYDVKPEGIVN